jgi:hypothetical protein
MLYPRPSQTYAVGIDQASPQSAELAPKTATAIIPARGCSFGAQASPAGTGATPARPFSFASSSC